MRNRELFKYIFAMLLFGSNGLVASFIDLSSYHIVLFRTLIGSILLIAIFFISGGRLTFFEKKKSFLFLAVSGISMGASWMFLYEAYVRIGIGIASVLYYCGSAIVMVLSPLLFRERLTVNKIFSFIATALGVVLINGNTFESRNDLFGVACGLLSAVTYALMVIFNKKAKGIVGLENSTLQLSIAFLTVMLFLGATQGYSMQIVPTSIIPIFILGALNTGIGCYLYFSSIGKLKAQTVVICGYLEPLSAVLFSVMFLKESLLPLQIVGTVLIIVGAMCSELIRKKH